MDLKKHLRTLVLGAALAFSALGMPALHAFAAGPQTNPQNGLSAGHLIQSGAVNLMPVISHDLPVQGGSTGQSGSPTDAQCQAVADYINGQIDQANQELNTKGMTARWNQLVDSAKSAQDEAENAGCFFINPV